MLDPPSGRRLVDETTTPSNPARGSDLAGGWPVWLAARSPSPSRCWSTNSGTSRHPPRSDSPIRSCGTPLPAGPVPRSTPGTYERGTWRLRQPWQVAVSVAAGVIVTYLTIIACVLAVRRFGPGPLSLVLGVGLVTPLRWLGAIPIFVSKLRGRLPFPSNTDEGWLAALTGIPETLLLLLGLTCLLLGYWFLVTAIPRGRRMRVVVPTLVGSVAVGGPRVGPVAGAADASVKAGGSRQPSRAAPERRRSRRSSFRASSKAATASSLTGPSRMRWISASVQGNAGMDPSRGRMRLRPRCPSRSEDASFRREGTTHRPG